MRFEALELCKMAADGKIIDKESLKVLERSLVDDTRDQTPDVKRMIADGLAALA